MSDEMKLVGFDSTGEPTGAASFSSAAPGEILDLGCAVKADGSPIVAITSAVDENSATLEVIGFTGMVPAWAEAIEVPAFVEKAGPEILLDEESARAWVFVGGTLDSVDPFVFAAALEI
ncbi:MAG: hypothetical protein HC927_07250 [Deltaproteobacteria bacterium]|nr:hypothetical protein [Deltaproteobacteria bacterium]